MTELSNKQHIAALVEICYQRGLHRVLISPGSRNAPLSISFLGHGGFDVRIVGDERVAGFMALGMSQTDDVATILVCTSGSAMLNYAPAISEACYQRVPLLVLTADRPEEWVDQMEGQTMRQSGALSNFVNAEYQLPQAPQTPDRLWYSDRLVNEAIGATTHPKSGAVHVNIPLLEPLYGTMSKSAIPTPKLIQPTLGSRALPTEQEWAVLLAEIQTQKRVMLILGLSHPGKIKAETLLKLRSLGIVVMDESCSNTAAPGILSWIDRSIAAVPDDQRYLPEMILSCGGPLVSKRIKTLLRDHDAERHWHIDEVEANIDLFKSLTRAVYAHPQAFLQALSERLQALDAGYVSDWDQLNEQSTARHEAYIAAAPYSDLKVYAQILPAIPAGVSVQMANSAAVRYAQLFPARPELAYYANRGVSGIDGCTSTAMGMAAVQAEPVVLLTGDMAFRYDANAFWLANRPPGLKCIVVNNEGGGIFRIIPGPGTTEHLTTAFEAHQDNGAQGLAELYKLPYRGVSTSEELSAALDWLFQDGETKILEIHTPREENAEVLRGYFEHLKTN